MSIVKALEFLGKSDILLASGSPRRLELLSRLEVPFLSQLAIPESVENLDYRDFAEPKEYVLANIGNKLQHGVQCFPQRVCRWKKLQDIFDANRTPALIVAADTVVVCGKEILEKPKSPDDNARMLRQLSGKTHNVITAVSFRFVGPVPAALLNGGASNPEPSGKEMGDPFQSPTTFAEETEVKFADLDEDTIRWYVDSKEGRDKAGGYGIGGLGAGLIESVQGCFYNVVGFPLNRFLLELGQAVSARPESVAPGSV